VNAFRLIVTSTALRASIPRGLKRLTADAAKKAGVAPHAGAWIETLASRSTWAKLKIKQSSCLPGGAAFCYFTRFKRTQCRVATAFCGSEDEAVRRCSSKRINRIGRMAQGHA